MQSVQFPKTVWQVLKWVSLGKAKCSNVLKYEKHKPFFGVNKSTCTSQSHGFENDESSVGFIPTQYPL